MKEILLLKYGEIALKGLNKSSFEAQLVKTIRQRIAKCGEFEIKRAQSTISIEPMNDQCDMDGAEELVSKVFGIATYSRCAVVEKDMESIKAAAIEYFAPALEGVKSYKCESKRSDKRFPLTSPQISSEVGGAIFLHFNGVDGKFEEGMPVKLKVDVANPDVVLYVEVRDSAAYIHAGQKKGAGGMPVGSGGRGMLLLSGGIDSPVAGYLMAKRGVAVHAVHFESFPYTSERARDKVLELADIISDYCGTISVNVVSLTKIQEEIKRCCDESYFTLLLRRSMMRIAARLARWNKCGCLITGESLGQVASQTMEAMAVTNDASDVPVLRPCVAMDKEEIVRIARKIGTFETSILPYEDCCTVFTPRHPTTRPRLEKIEEEEAKYDYRALEDEAINGRYKGELNR